MHFDYLKMRLKILPPVVTVVFGGVMYLLDRFLPVGEFDFFGRQEFASALFGLAVIVLFLGTFQFAKARTTTNPVDLDKTRALVSQGMFRYSRNPMYLAMLLILLAFGLNLGNAFNMLVAAGFVCYMNHFQIKHEEKALEKRFGEEYRAYCKETPRWF